MAVSIKNMIEYNNEQKTEEGLSYDIYLHGTLAGSIFVPNAPDSIITFSKKYWVNCNNIKVIAKQICEKYAKPVRVHGVRKVFEFTPTAFQKETEKHTIMCHYERYYVHEHHSNKYMASYRISGNNSVDLRLKKVITQKDAESVVFHFLGQYNIVNLTVSQTVKQPVSINKAIHDSNYVKMVISNMLDNSTVKKQEIEKKTDSHGVSTVSGNTIRKKQKVSEPIQPEKTPGRKKLVKPASHSKMTVYRSKNQSEAAARKSAQILANKSGCDVTIVNFDDSVLCVVNPNEKETAFRLLSLGQIFKEEER